MPALSAGSDRKMLVAKVASPKTTTPPFKTASVDLRDRAPRDLGEKYFPSLRLHVRSTSPNVPVFIPSEPEPDSTF